MAGLHVSAAHVTWRAKAESQDAICLPISSLGKGRQGNIMKPVKCAKKRKKDGCRGLSTWRFNGNAVKNPPCTVPTSGDDFGWLCSSLHVALVVTPQLYAN